MLFEIIQSTLESEIPRRFQNIVPKSWGSKIFFFNKIMI